MKTTTGMYASAVVTCLLVSSCGWVDSASTGIEEPVTEVFLDDMPVGSATVLNEKSIARITASRIGSDSAQQTFEWSEEPLEQGITDGCAALEGFDNSRAASSVSDACTDADECSLTFEPVEADSGFAVFELRAPELKAPVGVRYQLDVTDAERRVTTTEYEFCLVAINEAPVAVNDTFVVLEGEREVFAADELNLLSNDSDDVDESNSPLKVLVDPLEPPLSAAFFELREDGSFTYESSLSGILTDQFDSFRYQVTDGVHESDATATIRIVAINQAPELIDEIPVLNATEGEEFLENLGLYFVDPEASELSFSLAADTPLPGSGTLELSEDGLLTGTPDEDDVGSHALTLIVSDGGTAVETDILLMIEALPVSLENLGPEYVEDTVFNQIILLGRSIRPVIPEFIDPDGDTLTYAIAGNGVLPDGVEIDEDTGIVSGTPVEEINVRNLRIEATDPFGETATSDAFFIWVR